MKSPEFQRGMTLLEVLVAIAILALITVTTLQFQGRSLGYLDGMRGSELAMMVAENQLLTARLVPYAQLSSVKGQAKQAGMPFDWSLTVEAVDGFAMKRLEIEVSAPDEGRQLATLTGFIADPEP